MTIHIYNSLTKKKEELSPLDGKTVKMYSCGVTVYDKCHIGHARSLYIFDVMRQYLKHRGHDVRFVRNITDVDDKIINKAKELNKSFDDVVRENIEAYERDLENLGVAKADVEPRATQYIPKIIAFVEKLIKKDFAYEADGDVYYSVRKFEGYGKLSGQSVDQMIEATRIEQDPKKRDPLDFALWKKAKEEEKSWPSPWGEGRPGWHIECSCMSMNELQSDTIDIHAGGRDLIFPHHENEIAQSEALTGKPFANHWIHHGLLTINGQKMSKSLGNFITLDEILEKYPSEILKLFFLQSHYASPVDFSWEKMDEVKKNWEKFNLFLAEVKRLGEIGIEELNQQPAFVEKYKQEFLAAMDDDFNTPIALRCLFDLIKGAYRHKNHEDYPGIMKSVYVTVFEFLKNIFSLSEIGVKIKVTQTIHVTGQVLFEIVPDDLSDNEKELLEERKMARVKKDFKRSDEIREELRKSGIVVKDTKEGGQEAQRICGEH